MASFAMLLNSSDAAPVELRITGYQYPDYPAPVPDQGLCGLNGLGDVPGPFADNWDAKWLRVLDHLAHPA
jgi:hypothetical protein